MKSGVAAVLPVLKFEEYIFCNSRVKKWAYENAFTLIFLSVMFIITWCLIIVGVFD